MPDLDKETTKEAVKEALKEWLNDKLAEFGIWSMRGIAAAALVALTYFIMQMEGWHK